MSAGDEDEPGDGTKTVDSAWNVASLKKELNRLILRCHKKIGKADQRLTRAKGRIVVGGNNNNNEAIVSTDGNCNSNDDDNIEVFELELKELQDRLRGLNTLEEALSGMKNNKEAVLPKDVAALAIDLGVDDKPPARPARGPPKKKGPRSETSQRLPYRRYYSYKNVEIRVGKGASDNDELSLDPKHRDGRDWWMHASGCPGSHVVVRCTEDSVPEDVVQDAAALAARHSKARGSPIVKVTMTRCRDIRKPPGAKAGLVQLTGRVRTITVDMKQSQQRLERLDATVLVN